MHVRSTFKANSYPSSPELIWQLVKLLRSVSLARDNKQPGVSISIQSSQVHTVWSPVDHDLVLVIIFRLQIIENFHKFFLYIQSIHILMLLHYCLMFFVHFNLQSKFQQQIKSVNPTLFSRFEGKSLIYLRNFVQHHYLDFTELPRKVFIFKITAMNPK